MGNCCGCCKKKGELAKDEDPVDDDELIFYDGDDNRYVWDDENKQGFTKQKNNHHYTQDEVEPTLFWDDEDPVLCLDVGGEEENVIVDRTGAQSVVSIVKNSPGLRKTATKKKIKKYKKAAQTSVLANLPGESQTTSVAAGVRMSDGFQQGAKKGEWC
uniref:Uncharacterized protein n=1 Tax=Romanomermis culicivorax TaxID=13658 RepID=A0A915IEX5_ROMCU